MSRRLLITADGGSRGNPGPAGYGATVTDADTGQLLAELAGGIGNASNNVAEYRGLIAGLTEALRLHPRSVEVRMDSKLVVEQMSGRWKIKHPDMRALAFDAQRLAQQLPSVTYRHIPRAQNSHADRLANEAMDAQAAGRAWRPPTRPDVEPPAPGIGAEPLSRARPGTASGSDISVRAAESRGGTALFAADEAMAAWTGHTPELRLLLARHGATALTPERRFCGSTDASLSADGQAQAHALADRLDVAQGHRPLDRIVSSPLTRARETAEIIAGALGLDVEIDDALREADFGAWEGATLADVARRYPTELNAWRADARVAPPGGESLMSVSRRVAGFVDAARERGGALLAVSHVTVIKSVAALALGVDAQAYHRLHLDTGSLTETRWSDDGGVLAGFNDTAHLGVA